MNKNKATRNITGSPFLKARIMVKINHSHMEQGR